MKTLFDTEIEEPNSKAKNASRRKVQAWCKILGNRQRLGHRERYSFVKWAYNQAKTQDKLSEADLAYVWRVCQLANARIMRATLKRAQLYESAIQQNRDGTIGPYSPRHFAKIIADCECSKCRK